MSETSTYEIVLTKDITILNRIRKDLGDIEALALSIKDNGLIEPIVISLVYESNDDPNGKLVLIAGERRLTALKKLGFTHLIHGKHFIYRDELRDNNQKTKLLAASIEMEENIRRKDLTWVEQVRGKQKLLSIMQELHGVATTAPGNKGFGVRKLAAMLGESPEQTSNDLEMAALVTRMPKLASCDNREDARRLLTSTLIKAVVAGAKKTATIDENFCKMYEGDFRLNINQVTDESVDLIYTDLPYGVNLDIMSKHQSSSMSYNDNIQTIVDLFPDIARESYRILKSDRFVVFWFGMRCYSALLVDLTNAGFTVNPVPFIWYKHTNSTEQPTLRYANTYDQALVAWKGTPRFIRAGQPNLVDIQAITNKIHIAQQPIELPQKFMLDMTIEGNTVVDLMCGSGTTGEASILLKRRSILFEQNTESFNFTKSRIYNTIQKLQSGKP